MGVDMVEELDVWEVEGNGERGGKSGRKRRAFGIGWEGENQGIYQRLYCVGCSALSARVDLLWPRYCSEVVVARHSMQLRSAVGQ